MTDVTVALPGTVALEPPSTVLNPETVSTTSGGGKPDLGESSGSIQDVLTSELARLKADDKGAEKPDVEAKEPAKDSKPEKVEEKAETRPDRARTDRGQFAKAEAEKVEPEADKAAPVKEQDGQGGQDRGRQSEGRQHAEPPARFSEEAKRFWANVPNAVKADYQRIEQEHEAEKAQLRTSHERYEQVRWFDDLAKQNGRDLPQSLKEIKQFEDMLQRDPISAFDFALKSYGAGYSIYDLASHIVQNGPEAYQQRANAAQSEQANNEITALRQQVETMRTQMAASTVEQSVIAPFASSHPRFSELQDDIAMFLQSGKIPASLSPQDKLAEAYALAERLNPRSSAAAAVERDPAPEKRPERPVDLAGQKSIRGAPDDGFDPKVEDADTDIATLLRKEYRRIVA